ncbi:hypothetical protein MTR67_049457 [Solanum verrucosum]|uniref:GATA-type domain-containing protein n=1 Tax=Solanum verrucosum TaxID=315347 RepID=A0AAF0ZXF6_SOLVR|nr:hypothetical protein MTR67_049457 [Solanum verrucosum]
MTMVEHGGGYMDGVPTGPIVDEDFDDILNFLDMPMESLEEDGLGGVEWDVSESKDFGPIPTDALMDFPPMPQGNIGNRRVNAVAKSHPHPPGLARPIGNSLSTSEVGVSSTYTLPSSDPSSWDYSEVGIKFTEVQGTGTFQTQSPVSVLEGSNSCSGGKSIPIKHDIVIPVRPRSKRARPSAVNPWILMAPISSTRVASKKISDARKMKEKRRRLSLLSGAKEPMKNYVQQINDAALPLSDVYKKKITSTQQSSFFKKCTHCEVTKTPQWREGPLGPKTLCNACGVRYRSGRLFPEYRPAASPTFVPSVHSNSHRKVVEMRKKTLYGTGEVEEPPKVIMGRKSEALPEPTILADPAMSPAPEFVPMSSYLFDVY